MNPHTNWREKESILRLGSEAFWVFLGQIGAAAAGLVGVKILTSVLIPTEFGRLALANTVVALITANLFGPLGQGLMRYWPICRDRGDLHIFHPVANRIGRFAVGISLLIILTLVIASFATSEKNWIVLMSIALIVGIVTGWMNLRISVFTAARERRLVALLNIGNASLRPILAVLFVLAIAVSASWAMLGYAIAAIIIVIIADSLYSRNHSSRYRSLSMENNPGRPLNELAKEVITYSYPFLAWGIFGWMHLSCDRWSLQAFHGSEVVGAFAVVSMLASFPLIFGSGFLSNFFSPIAYQRAGDLSNDHTIISAYKIFSIMTGIYITGAIILVVLFTFLHRPLILLISNENFVKYSGLLPGLTFAWACYYLGSLIASFGLLIKKSQYYIFPKLVSSLVAVVSTFYLSYKLGPKGVVFGLMIAGIVYALWTTIIAVKIIKYE